MRCSSRLHLAAIAFLWCLTWMVSLRAMAQAPQRGPQIVSPEVLPDHRVTFRIRAPKASEVTLRGDWMEGFTPENLSKDDQGVWSVTVGPLTPDFYSYSFTVDGVKTLDPQNAVVKQGIRSLDNMFFLAGEEAAFQDNKPVPHGQIRQFWYRSGTLDAQRRMHIYTPPGYDESGDKYPALYLLHGGGDEDSGWSTIGRAGFILDNLIAQGKAKRMLVVMPNGSLPPPANMPAFTPGSPPSREVMAALQQRFINELTKALDKRGIKNQLHISGGGHTWINWRRYLNALAPQLFTRVLQVPPDFDIRRDGIERGKVETVKYDSKSVGVKRTMLIYTPPGYSRDINYPVLYLLHGIGDDETGWNVKGSADVILDNLYADKKLMPMIVVMPNGRASAEPRPANIFDPSNAEAYAFFENDLLKDVIPYVESHYSVQGDREHRALAGLSMGGGQALNFGLKHLETFAWVGGFSSAPNTQKAESLIADPAAAAKQLRLLWLSCGDKDWLMNISKSFHDALESSKVPHVWQVDSGSHEWPVWKKDLGIFSQMLFRDK